MIAKSFIFPYKIYRAKYKPNYSVWLWVNALLLSPRKWDMLVNYLTHHLPYELICRTIDGRIVEGSNRSLFEEVFIRKGVVDIEEVVDID